MEKRLYFLFLEKGCAKCAQILGRLDTDRISALEDDGADMEFHAVVSLTNNTTEELLSNFGIEGKHTPVMLYPDGKATDDVEEIMREMQEIGVFVVPSR